MMKDANLAQLAQLANCQNTKIFFLLIWVPGNPAIWQCQNALRNARMHDDECTNIIMVQIEEI